MISKAKAINLLRVAAGASCRCAKHGGGLPHYSASAIPPNELQSQHTAARDTDYAFDVVQSNLRFGEGVTQVCFI